MYPFALLSAITMITLTVIIRLSVLPDFLVSLNTFKNEVVDGKLSHFTGLFSNGFVI